jgi:hypothetical protein
MAITPSLFIQPILQRTQNISNPRSEVLSVQTNYAMIDSILAINLMSIPIFVSVYVSTNDFLIIPTVQVQPNSILQLLKESYFCLNTGETLLATSDSSQNLFSINVEGKIFLEIA